MRFHVMHPADPAHVAAVLDLALSAQPRCGSTLVIAIDGPSGAGKTTLARGVARSLGCPVVHLDDLYPGWDGLAEAVGLLTTQVLEPLRDGERAAYRRWDWEHDRWAETIDVPPTPILVVDGVGSSVRPAGDLAAVRVWVDADLGTRRRRGIERDGEAYRPHWERWARHEQALFASDGTRARADLAFDTTLGPEPAGRGSTS